MGHSSDVLLGVLYGDCLGAQYEFGYPDPSRPLFVGESVFGHFLGRGTDDTETALAVAYGLLDAARDGHLDDPCEHIADRLLAWLATGPADVGGTTRGGLDTYRRTGDPLTSGGTSDRSISNGSLMRSAPFALAYADPVQAATVAARSSRVTHGHPVVLDSVTAYVSLLGSLLSGLPQVTAERPTGASAQLETAVEHLDKPAKSIPCSGIGHAPYALTLAYWAAFSPLADTLSAGIEHVIRAGGDTDTNGAICGAVLAARHGFPGTLVRHLDQHRVHEVIDLTERLLTLRQPGDAQGRSHQALTPSSLGATITPTTPPCPRSAAGVRGGVALSEKAEFGTSSDLDR